MKKHELSITRHHYVFLLFLILISTGCQRFSGVNTDELSSLTITCEGGHINEDLLKHLTSAESYSPSSRG